jgi:type IV secretory pathway VirB4 component
MISELLRYTAITNNTIINMEDRTLTAVFELVISYLDLEEVMQERHDRFNKLLCELPADSSVSIYLTKIIQKPNLPVDKEGSDIVSYLDKKRKEMINSTPSPQYRCYMSLTLKMPVLKKDLRQNEKEEFRRLKSRLDNFIKTLQSNMPGSIIQLDSAQITTFLGHLLNHEDAANGQKISDIFTSDFNASINVNKSYGYVYYGGMYHAVLGFRAYGERSKLPDYTWASMNDIWHKDNLSNIEFTIQHQMCYESKEKALATAKSRKNMITARKLMSANLLRFLEKTPEGLNVNELLENVTEAIDLVETSGERFINWQYRVHVWDKSLEGLERKIDEMMAVVGTTHALTVEKHNIKAAYFALFPGCERLDTMKIMLPSYNVADYMPIDLPRTCFDDGTSGKYLYYYSERNELTRFDLFDRRASAWNGIVCGGTGSGKSFLLNDILSQFIKVYNGQVAICDYGGVGAGSYRNLVINAGGTYLEIDFNSDFAVNPFDGAYLVRKVKDESGEDSYVPDINGEPNPMKYTSLMATFERMIVGTRDIVLPAVVRSELRDRIVAYFKETNNNEANECNLNDFAERHLKGNQVLIDSKWDLYKEIMDFIGTGAFKGPYANFFTATKHIQNRNVCCFDLAGLKGHERLKYVLIPALLDMVCQDVLSNDIARKKMLLMDEAWQDLSRGGAMQDFIQEMYRTVRKLGGGCYTITQRFEDVLESSIGGALIANTHYFYFVGNTHKPEAIVNAEASSKQGNRCLSEYDMQAITYSLPQRDFYLLNPFFVGKLKFYPTKEFCVLATTDPKEKGIIEKYKQQFGVEYVTPEVIEAAKGEL